MLAGKTSNLANMQSKIKTIFTPRLLRTAGPTKLENGNFLLTIEMQTGDKIEIEAASFLMTLQALEHEPGI